MPNSAYDRHLQDVNDKIVKKEKNILRAQELERQSRAQRKETATMMYQLSAMCSRKVADALKEHRQAVERLKAADRS